MRSNRELDDAILEGHSVRSFLQNPQFQQSVEDVKTDIFNSWVNTLPHEFAVREQLWAKWHALDEVLLDLRKPIDEAKLATAEKRQNNYQAG